ncbi:MAG TPA: LuxR C-terminal-related transcriptional regulator [Nitrososphaera sp.]|nr:LuxR C-terminal-related transcriptional regulator [Nitrososphaera sp.]
MDVESAGDKAKDRFAYLEASSHYEQALAYAAAPEDEGRLCRKMGWALFGGVQPERATPFFERALECSVQVGDLHKKSEVLVALATMRWLESKTREALVYAESARDIVTAGAESRIYPAWVDSRIIRYLTLLGRHDEAARYMAPQCKSNKIDSWSQVYHLRGRATVYAILGQASRAFADFESILEDFKQMGDSFRRIVVSDDYAHWAISLGRLDIARAQYERGLFIARDGMTKWRVPFFGLQLSNALTMAEEYEGARFILADVMTHDTETPVLRVLRSLVSLQLGLATGDSELLKRATDEKALELAFLSGESRQINQLASGHIKLAALHGNVPRAKHLTKRALTAIAHADHAWEVLSLAARYGTPVEAARAKSLLQERMSLPHHRVARAYLELHETHAALRRKDPSRAQTHARKAAHLFAQLHWKCQQTEALALVGKRRVTAPEKVASNPLGFFTNLKPMLTVREKQVADLVLKGFTNRGISEKLSISEHTVESHMTSILNRFGLRSRWQLLYLIN